jgi:hypothetical protein
VAQSDQFSISDADALLELIYSDPNGRIVIVGGQAVNFWADRYARDEPRLLAYRPFTSRDLDLLASIANAYRLASDARSAVEKPRAGAASPVLANVEVRTGRVVRSVQFLKAVRGVTNPEIDANAVQFEVGHVKISVADPITMLKSKLHNVVDLDQRGRNDRNHVEILRLCVPLFLERQLSAAEEFDAAARDCLRNMQRIIKLSRLPIARRIGQFDWNALIPIARLTRATDRRQRCSERNSWNGGCSRLMGSVKRVSNEGLEPLSTRRICQTSTGKNEPVSKRFQMVGFKGPSQEKSTGDIFRFGY